MNKRFKFYIQKAVAWYPRFVLKEKTLVVAAHDSVEARKKVLEEYPDWDISMFWPVWP